MAPFSERMGITPPKAIQIDSMDDELRNSLWNALVLFYWQPLMDARYHESLSGYSNLEILAQRLWLNFFKWPLNTLSQYSYEVGQVISKYFFGCEWWRVYGLVEYVSEAYPDQTSNRDFVLYCNAILEREKSPYRFVGEQLVRLTAEQEIAAIEEAMAATAASNRLAPVHTHLNQALAHLSDRQAPDYSASMNDSISAVEAVCGLITGNPKATLGQALKDIERQGKLPLHASLKEGFQKLYGYTSDADGIRHALKDKPTVDYDDAKLLLVECTAFVNWLIAKATKAGISL